MRQTEAYDEFRKNNEPPKWWTPRYRAPCPAGADAATQPPGRSWPTGAGL